MIKKYFLPLTFMLIAYVPAFNQSYNLQYLLDQKKLITSDQHIIAFTDAKIQGVSTNKIAWLKDVTFSNGTIEIDLRGKDVLQKSFIGIAFHGVDTVTYDAIYFRPFNFQSLDSVRKIHAVQYVSEPDNPWHKLRDEQNGIYEKGISLPPSPLDWFHARLVIKDSIIKVYVNHAAEPSLTVNKLNNRKEGLIGIWAFGLTGDFANLVIKN